MLSGRRGQGSRELGARAADWAFIALKNLRNLRIGYARMLLAKKRPAVLD